MSSDAGTTKGSGRRTKVFLSPSQKYEIYVRLMRQETTVGAAAAEAGVDRSTIVRMTRTVTEQAVKLVMLEKKGGLA